tara:strand:- start:118 stop:336 length:219 start_codon:yes stop_codon:yes gene_type:complete
VVVVFHFKTAHTVVYKQILLKTAMVFGWVQEQLVLQTKVKTPVLGSKTNHSEVVMAQEVLVAFQKVVQSVMI